MDIRKLSVKQLFVPGSLTQKDLPIEAHRQIIGQDRALAALNYALLQNDPHSHIFCLGPKGVGRTTLTKEIVQNYAFEKPTPADWIYVNNFSDPLKPKAISVLPGTASFLKKEMDALIKILQKDIQNTVQSENYQQQIHQIQNQKVDFEKQLSKLINTSQVALVKSPQGLGLSPVVKGKILEADAFNALSLKIRKPIMEAMEKAKEKLIVSLNQMAEIKPKIQEDIQALNQQIISSIWNQRVANIEKKYRQDTVLEFLNACHQHLKNHALEIFENHFNWDQLKINALTTHLPKSGAPVVHLSQFNLSSLLGRIERVQQAGSLISDHTMIEAGALHQANGGYLIIEAKDIPANMPTWKALKHALFTNSILLQSQPDENSILTLRTLSPGAIPLNVKVILIGDNALYYDLISKDEDIATLFKLPVRFEDKFPRTHETEKLYVGILADIIQNEHLKPFSIDAMNLVLAFASRLTQDQQFLSAYISQVKDLMREAHFVSQGSVITSNDVQTALLERSYRTGSLKKDWENSFQRGFVHLDVQGTKVGQINALVVHELGAFAFSHPSCITCRVHAGNGKIEDIERDVTLGGNLHSKGVLILGAYLESQYGTQKEPVLDASIVWEQSYNGIEGDSASATELCALMSAISQIPLNQEIAITGSVNQWGEIQSVGSVNEKIEGFFDACALKGLTKGQGVIIPRVSEQNLMLAERVCQAVKKGLFHIYSVSTIDEAMEILSNVEASKIHQKIKQAWFKRK